MRKTQKEKDREELKDYRRKPSYTGYEDYSPAGRAALSTYNKESKGAKDIVRKRGEMPVSPSAAKKAQAAGREAGAEVRRETRGKANKDDIGYDNLEDVNKHKWKGTM